MSGQIVHLVFRAGGRLCALPLANIVETTPSLPIERIADPPEGVLGIAIVRGAPLPVIDAHVLFGGGRTAPQRFLVLRVATRKVVIAIDGVEGIRTLPPEALTPLPRLLGAEENDRLARIGLLDAELLLVLRAGGVLAEADFDRVMAAAS